MEGVDGRGEGEGGLGGSRGGKGEGGQREGGRQGVCSFFTRAAGRRLDGSGPFRIPLAVGPVRVSVADRWSVVNGRNGPHGIAECCPGRRPPGVAGCWRVRG